MWQSPDSYSLSPLHQEWLNSKESLTKKLKGLWGNHFKVQVHLEYFTDAIDESFNIPEIIAGNENFYLREVTLNNADTPLVFARTIVPQTTLNTHRRAILDLGSASLGTYLFDRCSLERDDIKIAHIDRNHPLHQSATAAVKHEFPALWSRRSTFRPDGKPLLVTETFLPRFWEELGS